jgi:hypothetical protein
MINREQNSTVEPENPINFFRIQILAHPGGWQVGSRASGPQFSGLARQRWVSLCRCVNSLPGAARRRLSLPSSGRFRFITLSLRTLPGLWPFLWKFVHHDALPLVLVHISLSIKKLTLVYICTYIEFRRSI